MKKYLRQNKKNAEIAEDTKKILHGEPVDIELFANIDIGGYAWARYGFCVKSRNEAIGAIRFSALTAKQEKRIMELIDGHFDTSSTPFPMNKIARLPYGKKALLGRDWEGILDLTDTQQRRVFERYLRR